MAHHRLGDEAAALHAFERALEVTRVAYPGARSAAEDLLWLRAEVAQELGVDVAGR